ncbi:MAG TPA: DNA replication and repair protein RecF, partial [Candidatus Krumholzibacterium sp.]|nr:DNA replication and repair protein RecF [Candidatus Krumholzibacterium sp.]
NLLEAIHMFSLGRSFRTRKPEEMISFGEEYFFVRLSGASDTGIGFTIELGLERGGRIRAGVNGNRLPGLSGIIGMIPSVIFTPDDVGISSGPPASRRLYIDYTAAQISPAFLADLKEFKKALMQRNALLRKVQMGTSGMEELDAWNDVFVEKGAAVALGRAKMLEPVRERAAEYFSALTTGREDFEMEYDCSFAVEGPDAETGPAGGETLRGALEEALARTAERELRRGYTLAGPQFDDITLRLGGKDLRRYGSQGRRRLAAIVMKLAQAAVIMEGRAERPVVLLDDIFSELDSVTAEMVRSHLTDRYQSFITSPVGIPAPAEGAGSALIEVSGGVFSAG